MNYSRLLFTIFLAVGCILVFAVWSNSHAFAQQPSSPPSTASSPSTTISPEIKAKMCDPSNPDLKIVNTTEARICGIPKTVKPSLLSSSAMPQTPSAAQLPKSTVNGNNNSSVTTTTTNVAIVLRPLPGGTCPTGYHLVSGAVCIKDLPSTAQQQTTPTASTPTITTNATKSFPISSPHATTQPSTTNPTKNDNNDNSNNEENFHTKILKSFNKEFK
jgi:hypothetical protein